MERQSIAAFALLLELNKSRNFNITVDSFTVSFGRRFLCTRSFPLVEAARRFFGSPKTVIDRIIVCNSRLFTYEELPYEETVIRFTSGPVLNRKPLRRGTGASFTHVCTPVC